MVNGERSLLFQLRHSSKDTFPGLLDISCAGHLLAGEHAADGVRELEEELGLQVAFEDLTACGVFKVDYRISEHMTDREFYHVFIYQCDQPLMDYDFQKDEVSGLYWVTADELEKLVYGEMDQIQATGVVVNESDGLIRTDDRLISSAEIVPHPFEYYKMILNACKN